jgi:hypothetical protein
MRWRGGRAALAQWTRCSGAFLQAAEVSNIEDWRARRSGALETRRRALFLSPSGQRTHERVQT